MEEGYQEREKAIMEHAKCVYEEMEENADEDINIPINKIEDKGDRSWRDYVDMEKPLENL